MVPIPTDPRLPLLGGLGITWGTATLVIAVMLATWRAVHQAERNGFPRRAAYDAALWAIAGGLAGGRILHIVNYWSYFSALPWRALFIWDGGVAVWGVLCGGGIAAYVYLRRQRMSVPLTADITALPLVAGMMLARLGDVITGARLAKPTSMPWGFIYTDPQSASYTAAGTAVHPAMLYELLWLGVVFWVLRRYRERLWGSGWLCLGFLGLYAAGRFIISFARIDRSILGLHQDQYISLAVLGVLGWLLWRKRQQPQREPDAEPKNGQQPVA